MNPSMKKIISLFPLFFSLSSFAAETVEGPWIRSRTYDYRYVTTYEINVVKKALKHYPWIEEDCHDQGSRFASWSQSISYEVSYGGSVGFSLLGILEVELGADRSRTHEFTFQRWVTPTLGVKARHILHEEYEVWTGSTIKEYKFGTLIEKAERSTAFNLEKVNYGLSVVRKITGECPGY